MKPFARLLLAGALIISIGAQWAVLQGVAWVGMAVSYSIREGSVAEGLSQTFDGKHPCPLCLAAKKGAAGEGQDDPAAPAPRKDGPTPKVEMCLFAQPRALAATFTRLPVLWESRGSDPLWAVVPDGPPPEGRL